MGWYVDGEALYEQTVKWEAAALEQVNKLCSKPRGEMGADEIAELQKWNCILNERSAFKYDVADALIVNAVVVVRCKDCKHNPKDEWFECPMSHLSDKQRPETAWCWKGERKDTEDGCCIQ